MDKTLMPTLKTERLILRRAYTGDLALYEALSDREVAKYECWSPHKSFEQTMLYINSVMEKYENGDCTEWVIENKKDGYPIGMINLHDIYPQHRRAEMGFWLNRKYWGQGFATEAAKAVMNYAFTKHDTERLQCLCFTGNEASIHVLEKLGMKREAVLERYMSLTYDQEKLSDVALYVKFNI